jgi:hypothetical protein
MVRPAPPPGEPNATERMAQRIVKSVTEVRARMDERRAARGLGPATDEEFTRDYHAEVLDWYERDKEFKRTGRYPGDREWAPDQLDPNPPPYDPA